LCRDSSSNEQFFINEIFIKRLIGVVEQLHREKSILNEMYKKIHVNKTYLK